MKVRFNALAASKSEMSSWDLTDGNIYEVLEVHGDSYRVLGDFVRANLHPISSFNVVDGRIRADWIKRPNKSGGYDYHLPEDAGCFWEALDQAEKYAIRRVRQILIKWRREDRGSTVFYIDSSGDITEVRKPGTDSGDPAT